MRFSFALAVLSLLIASVACKRQPSPGSGPVAAALPGMPPIIDRMDIYSEARAGMLSPVVRGFPDRVYVPNSGSNTVDVIDPKTFKVVDHFAVGRQPQHVTPSYDLKTLWVLDDLGDSLTRIDPATGRKGETIFVKDPYNMYYTPDGKFAIVVAERVHRLDFYDAKTMKLSHSLSVPGRGVDHMDFAADGSYLIASCEFTGDLIKVKLAPESVVGVLKLPGSDRAHRGKRVHYGGGRMPMEAERMPQDVKTSPDGKLFYVADMMADGVHVIDPERFVYAGFIPTGTGAHGPR